MGKNKKTTILGILGVVINVIGHIWPKYKGITDTVSSVVFGSGLVVAKDWNVTGGRIKQ